MSIDSPAARRDGSLQQRSSTQHSYRPSTAFAHPPVSCRRQTPAQRQAFRAGAAFRARTRLGLRAVRRARHRSSSSRRWPSGGRDRHRSSASCRARRDGHRWSGPSARGRTRRGLRRRCTPPTGPCARRQQEAGAAAARPRLSDVAHWVRVTPTEFPYADLEYGGQTGEIASDGRPGPRLGALMTVRTRRCAEQQVAVPRDQRRRDVAQAQRAQVRAPVAQRRGDRPSANAVSPHRADR